MYNIFKQKIILMFSGIQMLSLLVPILVDCLLEGSSLKQANKYCKVLHEQSLQWLTKIGPQYPQVRQFFKVFFVSSDH